ncbi:MAG: CinA family protein [Microbacteriaceae bacterium]|nr:CinA family protein [Microbacteriaceae bacterium]
MQANRTDVPGAQGNGGASDLIDALAALGLTVAVAESLTGGLLIAELIAPAGASAVINGGVVAYNTELKRTLLGVDAALLSKAGPVHPEVARQLARNVRNRLGIDGRPADVGIATTGVAGPDPVGGIAPGVVFLGLSVGDVTRARELTLHGSRQQIRAQTVTAALEWMAEALERGLVDSGE